MNVFQLSLMSSRSLVFYPQKMTFKLYENLSSLMVAALYIPLQTPIIFFPSLDLT